MKKYRLVIADDEYYIRIRIKNIIDWNNLPIELVGEAENGQQVIDLLQTDVDIVLLDIKMPGLSGIEVAEQIKSQKLSTKVIILSGFNDFDYAQKCIRYGVIDYLLKPVDQKVLNGTLSKATELLDQENERKSSSFEDKQIQELLYLQALNDPALEEDFLKKYINIDCNYSQFIGIFATDSLQQLLENLCQTFDNGIAFQVSNINNNSACIQFFYSSEKTCLNADLLSYLLLDHNAAISIGDIFNLSDDWSVQHLSIQDMLLNRYFSSSNQLYFQKPPTEDRYVKKLLELRYQIITSVNKGSLEIFRDKLAAAKKEIIEESSVNMLKLFINEIAVTLELLLPAQQGSQPIDSDKILQKLTVFNDLDDLFAYILDYFEENMNNISSQPHDIVLAEKIVSYIENNFKSQKVSVSSISDVMGITASYAGIIFKRVNNLSINQYLNNIRIEKACQLIKEGKLKISDIGLHVGYNDVFYFSRRFKSIVGVSPKEYQKAHLKEPKSL